MGEEREKESTFFLGAMARIFGEWVFIFGEREGFEEVGEERGEWRVEIATAIGEMNWSDVLFCLSFFLSSLRLF